MIAPTLTYWKLGNGDPYTGGRFGFDSETIVDGEVVASATYRPDGAVDVTKAEYDALVAAFQTEWDQRAIGGAEYVAAVEAAALALREGAKAKLIAGQPLTAAEAASITAA